MNQDFASRRARKAALLVASSLPALLWLAGTARSQDAASGSIEEVTVSGIRESVEQAIAVKRNAATLVDAITAEDIGKLPDQNVVETLQRITGVQIDRGRGNSQVTSGEGTGFTIRGIGQNRVEFNGTNLVGAANSGDVQLSDFNPDILAGLVVTKSPSASDAEGAIGGIVNLITKKPLDLSSFFASGRAEGVYYDQAQSLGYRASGVISAKFLDDTLGILIGASRYDYHKESQRFDTDGWTMTNNIDVTGDGIPDPGMVRPNRMVMNMLPTHQTRDGLNGSIQWIPADDFELDIDLAYTDAYRRIDSLRLQTLLTDAVTGARADANGTIVAGTYTNPTMRPSIYSEIDYETQQVYAATAKWTPGRFTVEARGAHSTGYTDNPIQVPLLMPKAGRTTTVTTNFQSGADVPTYILNQNYDPLDYNNYQLISNFETIDIYRNSSDEARLNITYDTGWDWIHALKIGARYEALTLNTRRFDQNPSAAQILAADPSVDVNHDGVIGAEELTGISFSGLPTNNYLSDATGIFVKDWLGGRVDFPVERAGLGLSYPPLDLSTIKGVDQKTWAGYAQVDLDAMLAGVHVSGNLGVRLVDSDRTASGYVIGTTSTLTHYDAHFTDVLPSLNLRADLSDNLVLRVDASKVLARPALNQVAPGILLNVINFTGSRGNPNLQPFRATAYDAAIEWYFNKASILSLTGFYKDISSFTINTTDTEFFNNGAATGNYLVTQPTNGGSGKIAGLELGYQQVLQEGFLNGLGGGLSYTYATSSTPLIDSLTGLHDPLPGLSKNSFNITAFYERHWGNVRLTYNWRGKYLDVQQGASLGGNLYEADYGQLDMSGQLNITDRLRWTLEIVNILKNPDKEYVGYASRLQSYDIDDRRIYTGFSFTW